MKSFAQPPLSPAPPVATDAIHHVALHMLLHLTLHAKFLIAAKERSGSTLQTIQRNISSQLYVHTTANKQNKTARIQRAGADEIHLIEQRYFRWHFAIAFAVFCGVRPPRAGLELRAGAAE